MESGCCDHFMFSYGLLGPVQGGKPKQFISFASDLWNKIGEL